MTLGNPVAARYTSDAKMTTRQVPSQGPWQTCIDATGLSTQDASTITKPTSQIVHATRREIHCDDRAPRFIALRAMYNAASTDYTQPKVVVFGCYEDEEGTRDEWMFLHNRNDSRQIALAVESAADVRNEAGTIAYGKVDKDDHLVDRRGCNRFLVGVETTVGTPTGGATLCGVQFKFVDDFQ